MSSIPYNLGIPAASHNPSNDQPLMQQNNDAIDQIISVDHFSFNTSLDPTNSSGYHQWSTYVTLDPGNDPTSIVDALRLYSKFDGDGKSELYFKRDGSGSIIQLTGVTPSATADGWTFLPGNAVSLLMQWQIVSMTTPSFAFSFPRTFTSTPFLLQATIKANVYTGAIVNVGNVTTAGATLFTANATVPSPLNVYVLSIGIK